MMPPRIGPGDRPDQRGHRPDDGRERGLLLGEDAQQQHLRQRHDRAAEQAEQHARAEQHAERARQAAQQRDDRERQVTGDEGALRAELPGEPAGQRHGDRLGDRIGGDDPRSLGRRHAEVAGDRRDRHVGDRRVEHDQEVAQPDQDGGDVKAHAGQRTGKCRLRSRAAALAIMALTPWRSVGDVDVDVHRQADAKRVLLRAPWDRARCAPAGAAPP